MSTSAEGVSLILPVRQSHPDLAARVAGWTAYLKSTRRPWELLLVADGVEVPSDLAGVRMLTHDAPRGFGACLRTALPETIQPVIATAALDYPYTPTDLGKLLDRLGTASEVIDPATDDFAMKTPDLVASCRTGVPVPAPLRTLGGIYRFGCKLFLGLPLDPLPSWYGFGEHARAWWAWIVYGNPLHDPNSALRVYRRDFVTRFPIQSDGDCVHLELIAKATFLTCLMDEIPLTPQAVPLPPTTWAAAEKSRLFNKPKFWHATFTHHGAIAS